MAKLKDNKAQVTIWVIVGVILIAAVVIVFLLVQRQSPLPTIDLNDPRSFLEKCTKDATVEAINIMLPQGGLIAPDNYYLYDDIKVPYYYYTNGCDVSATGQLPPLYGTLVTNITSYIQPKLEQCFSDIQQEAKRTGSSITYTAPVIGVSLNSENIYINVNSSVKISRADLNVSFKKFDVSIQSSLKHLVDIGQEIAGAEANNNIVDYISYRDPKTTISLLQLGNQDKKLDQTKIYTIKDIVSGEALQFAVRSHVPPGDYSCPNE